jgi:hypothetical protein
MLIELPLKDLLHIGTISVAIIVQFAWLKYMSLQNRNNIKELTIIVNKLQADYDSKKEKELAQNVAVTTNKESIEKNSEAITGILKSIDKININTFSEINKISKEITSKINEVTNTTQGSYVTRQENELQIKHIDQQFLALTNKLLEINTSLKELSSAIINKT